MCSVTSGARISLTSLANPPSTVEGRLLSIDGRYAEAALDDETSLPRGCLVQFETPEVLYLGEIESGWMEAGASRVRILIEHSVDLEKAAAIRRLWETGSPA